MVLIIKLTRVTSMNILNEVKDAIARALATAVVGGIHPLFVHLILIGFLGELSDASQR